MIIDKSKYYKIILVVLFAINEYVGKIHKLLNVIEINWIDINLQ